MPECFPALFAYYHAPAEFPINSQPFRATIPPITMNKTQKLIFILIGFAIVLFVLSFFTKDVRNVWLNLNTNETKAIVFGENPPRFTTDDDAGVISDRNKSLWKAETIKLSADKDIERFFFYDENIIYGFKYEKFEDTIFKSLNGGKSWEKVSFLTDLSISDVFFLSPDEAFIAADKLKPSSSPSENGSIIMKTTDGGKHWETVYSSVNIGFSKLAFNSDGTGLAIGRRETTKPVMDTVHLALITKDKGQTWTDVSAELNKIEVSQTGQVADYSTDVLFSKNKGIVVLSLRGKIYNTTDEGQSWSLISKIIGEPDQTGIYNFGELENENFWLAGGTISIEGKWGMLAVMNSRYGWNRYRLNGYYFSDVKFLSDKEVLASGAKVAPENFGGSDEENTGVILYSSDSGKHWTIIHQSNSTKSFGSFNKLSENKWFVSGEKNSGVILERQ